MMMSKEQAKDFASRWLPAWTGNDPEKLVSFYSDDAYYQDHTIPQGVKGRDELLAHFRTLLSQSPNQVWTQIEAIPMEGGFLNKWLAKIPVGEKIVECIGVCLIQFDDNNKIRRNETYFDPRELIIEILKLKKTGK
jgi:steroid delta-isomerase-like uncharacterized protein